MALITIDPQPDQHLADAGTRNRWPGLALTGRKVRIAVSAIALAGVLHWGAFGPLSHRIDDNADFTPPAAADGGSAAVAMAAALIQREVNDHNWSPNDPWFAPNALLDNMPNYQHGMMRAIGRFSFEMLDQIARSRGSSSNDPDLERASGYLQFPADIWMFDFQKSWLPTVPSEDQYRAGLRMLERYNTRLAAGQAVFQRRADAFAGTLQRISADLGSQTAQLDQARQYGWWVFSNTADDVFYQNKGMLYAYYMMLDGLGEDFESLIRERGLSLLWRQTLDSLHQASQLHPVVVLNGDPESSIFANHLLLQGFYMKRAILQLEEVASALAM